MVRSLIGFLIIAVIFLAGMVVGGNDEPQSIKDSMKLIDFNPELEAHPEDTQQIPSQNEHLKQNFNETKQETQQNFTQMVASSLESVVKGFYDLVVQLCYAFANLFF